jgi:hypothetical protein
MAAKYARFLITLAVLGIAPAVLGQGSCDFARPKVGAEGPSQATTQKQDLTGSTSPTRVTEKRTESGGRTVITRTLETVNVDGTYSPVAVCEKEVVKSDARSERVTQRSFGFDADGRKVLLESSQQQVRDLGNGGKDAVRTVSQPDANGQMHVVRREQSQSRPVGSNAQETRTTVMMPDTTGTLVPSGMTREVRRQTAPGVEEVRSTQMLPDGNGGWHAGEVKEQQVRTDANGNRTIDQKVFRPDANMNLSLSERQVIRDTKQAGGVERRDVNTFGQTPAGAIGSVSLDSSMQVVSTSGPGGAQKTQSTIEQRDPIAPGQAPKVTESSVQVSRPNAAGRVETKRSTSVADPSGNMTQVTVSIGEEQPAPKQATQPAAKEQQAPKDQQPPNK